MTSPHTILDLQTLNIFFFIIYSILGSASVVKGLSAYLDNLCGHAMENFLSVHLPMSIDGLNQYPDIFAFSVTIIFAWAIAIGVKESTRLNTIFTVLNLSVVVFVIGAGLFKGNNINCLPFNTSQMIHTYNFLFSFYQ